MTHIFASDYDGTLFKDRMIREADLEAIKAFRAQGHKFGIVTGRSINSIVIEINKYAIPVDFIVGINGGAVLTHDYQEIFLSHMDNSVVEAMMRDVETFDVRFYGANDGYRLGRVFLSDASSEFEPNVEMTDIEELKRDRGIRAMYVVTKSHEVASALTEFINQKYESKGVVAFQNLCAVDIGAQGVTKATGIQCIREHYHYDGMVYTIGDSYNDLPMIEGFHGFAMAQGEDAIKAVSQGVYSTVGDAIQSVLENK